VRFPDADATVHYAHIDRDQTLCGLGFGRYGTRNRRTYRETNQGEVCDHCISALSWRSAQQIDRNTKIAERKRLDALGRKAG
jgi:hypothetical protein